MNKYFNPRLLNTVVSGPGMKHPRKPHVIIGDKLNGFVQGDLMDANAVEEFIDQKIESSDQVADMQEEIAHIQKDLYKDPISVGTYLFDDGTFGDKLEDGKEVIGVCVIPPNTLPDGDARFMSIRTMSNNYPDTGYDGGTSIPHGGDNVDTSLQNFSGIIHRNYSDTDWEIYTNGSVYISTDTYTSPASYGPAPNPYTDFQTYSTTNIGTDTNALSDFDGKHNTDVLISMCTGPNDWKTASYIPYEYGEGCYLAAECCWRFNPGYTNQGDWYIPSIGELCFVAPNALKITNAFSILNINNKTPFTNSMLSSTEYDKNQTYQLSCNDPKQYPDRSWYVSNSAYKSSSYNVYAFIRISVPKELYNKTTKIPTKTSELENDSSFLGKTDEMNIAAILCEMHEQIKQLQEKIQEDQP